MHFPSLLSNLHWVTPDLARCAQPFTYRQWKGILQKQGFGSVINLRGENPKSGWYRDEVKACQNQSCQHCDVRLSSKRLPSRESLLELLGAFSTLPKPLLVKCGGGADRTGFAVAVYLINAMGPQALERALDQLRFFPYLHRAKPRQRWIKEFFPYFIQTQGDLTFSQWAERVYTPEKLASYLLEQGKGDYWARD